MLLFIRTFAKLVVLCLVIAYPLLASERRIVNDSDRVTLQGNVHPHARQLFEVGATAPSLPMERMVLSLRLSAEKEAALKQLIAEQHDPLSINYHHWLTPEEYGERFGPAPEDTQAVTNWLTSQGFSIDEVAKGRTWVNFSGTVADVERAFRLHMRNYNIKGRLHHANAQNPSIPRGLIGLVAGVSTLHNFPRRQMNSGIRPFDVTPDPDFTSGGGTHSLAPGDFAAIYNLNPLYSAGIDGTGQTVAIVGRTHPSATNWNTFRSTFGLSVNTPQVIVNGTDPGDLGAGEDGEADLDVEWSGAIAKNAAIKLVVSKSTAATDGVDLSAQYIVNNNLSPVMSISFGQCEAQMGTTEQAFFNTLWSQAVTQGITVFVATGDSGAAGCDDPTAASGSGPGVSGLATTPFNVAVGGTGFSEGAGSYWNTSNSSTGVSVKSYIPEVAWNESSLASSCPADIAPCTGLWATSGGSSSTYAKPEWQTGLGVPADGKRDVPDVSLAAGSHDGYRVRTQGAWHVFGGTSVSSPAFAGIMALIVQKSGQRQGNANPRFYQLADAQRAPGGPAVYHDITSGNNSVSGVSGYFATAGYDLATGLGSVDATQLVDNWVATAPGAPIIGTATAGNGQATVSFTSPTANGGSVITLYTVTSNIGGFTGTGTASPITVTGLTNGTPYTFTVTAANSAGTSVPSAPSNSVTPLPGTINGVCGSSNGGTFTAIPSGNLCQSGTASVVSGSGPWSWNCGGLNGGTTASCSAAIQTYAVTFQSVGSGTLAGTTSQVVNFGGSTTAVTAVPAVGNHFVSWTGIGGFVTSTSNPLTVANVTSALTITANFAVDPTNGVCGSSNGGTFTAIPSGNLCQSGTASVVSGSGPWSWNCGGLNGGTTASCSAAIQTYAVTFQSVGSGTLAGTTSQVVNFGGSTTAVTAVPAVGNHFVSWTGIGGFVTSTSNPLTVANVTSALTITANFAADPTNGACGSSNGGTFRVIPSGNLCLTGTASIVSGSGPWSWNCGGLNGGTTAICSAAIDITGPALVVSTLAGGAITNNATLNISGTVSDTSGVNSLTINNVIVTVSNGGFSYPVTLQAGKNIITIIAADTLGNVTTDIRTITLDQTAPTLTIAVPADNSKTAQGVATISGTINETSTIIVSVNSGAPQSASITGTSFSASINLAGGINSITIKATDPAGNQATAVRTVTYDNGNPTVVITNPGQDITTAQKSITIGGTVSDTFTSVSVAVAFNNQTFTPTVTNGDFSQQLTIPAEGTWPVTVTATNEVGNMATATRNFIYTPPTIGDALKVLQAVAGITALTASEKARYDVAPLGSNGTPAGNGVVDAADVIAILRRSIGIGNW